MNGIQKQFILKSDSPAWQYKIKNVIFVFECSTFFAQVYYVPKI